MNAQVNIPQPDYSTKLMGKNSIFSGISIHTANRTQVVTFFLNQFNPEKHSNCLVLGETGSGKTFATVAFVSSVCETYQARCLINDTLSWTSLLNAEFMSAYQLWEAQRSSFKDDKDRRDRIETVQHLIIDDLGTEPQVGFKNNDFIAYFQSLFIQRHQNRKNTYITSNLTLGEFKETYGERILSRLRDTGLVFETPDKDLRVKP